MKRGLTKIDHAALRARGVKARCGSVLLVSIPNDGEGIVYGFTISKKHGNAVMRNKIRRRLDAALRAATGESEPDIKLVLIPLNGENILSCDFTALVADIRKGLDD